MHRQLAYVFLSSLHEQNMTPRCMLSLPWNPTILPLIYAVSSLSFNRKTPDLSQFGPFEVPFCPKCTAGHRPVPGEMPLLPGEVPPWLPPCAAVPVMGNIVGGPRQVSLLDGSRACVRSPMLPYATSAQLPTTTASLSNCHIGPAAHAHHPVCTTRLYWALLQYQSTHHSPASSPSSPA